MAFAAVLELSGLDGTNGFRALGVGAIDDAGWSVASAGDVNGDGIADLIIGARLVDANGGNSGASYVVFGRDTIGDGDFPADFALSALDGADGFRISGGAALDRAGQSVASAGDVNGDGIDDLIIGAWGADPNGASNSGASYVVFGRDTQTAGAFAADLDVNDLDGTNGFRISGATADDRSGFSVASAGDINGDGIDDLIVGAPTADANGLSSGASYVVFGRDTLAAGAFAADLNVSALDGTNGFRIVGAAAPDQSGYAVSSAGDVNGDGIDDLIVGAPWVDPTPGQGGAGAIFVVFGKDTAAAGGFAADLNLSALDGTNGFRVDDGLPIDMTGYSVSAAGDINGDGVDDLIFGSPGADPNGDESGSSYVVFGRNTAAAGAFAANLSVTDLDGTNGFRINGVAAGDGSGLSVASAGDVNGDGYGDVIVSAHLADPNGGSSGASFVVFGGGDGFAAVLELSALDGTNGFRINGVAAGDIAGRSVAAAGDVNGDGVDDLIIGANGVNGTGGAYLVFGVVDPVTFVGTPGDDAGRGSVAADSLSGLGGRDVLRGLAGADTIDGGDGNDLLDGGAGADQMTGGSGDDTYIVDDAGDTASEAGGGGSDRVRASVSFTLDADLDNLQLTGAANLDGTGNSGANQIDGNGGNNILAGGGGADIMRGGGGADTVSGDDGADQLLGGVGEDTLNGGADNDRLAGEADNDLLNGGAGSDILDGGAANDTLNGDAGGDRLNGGDGSDTLNGGADNDVLNGGAAADILAGGTGDDTYFADEFDSLSELAGEGADTVRASGDWTLGGNFERLILEGGSNLNGTGNDADNVLTGNGGSNILDGAGGVDILRGGLGTDTLIGGSGNDILSGGGGADSFVVRQESVFSSLDPQGRTIETDSIGDYAIGQDIIDLSAIDAIGGGADDAFAIVAAFNGLAGQMVLKFAAGTTTLELDVDGDRSADYRMKINGDVRGDTAGWLL